VFGVEPDLTREGGSIPVALTFQEATGQNVMLLPVISSENFSFGLRDRVTSCHRCSIWWLFYTARANRFVLLWTVKQQRQVGSHQNIRDVHTGQ